MFAAVGFGSEPSTPLNFSPITVSITCSFLAFMFDPLAVSSISLAPDIVKRIWSRFSIFSL